MVRRQSLLARILVWHGLAMVVVAVLAAGSVAWLLDTTSTRLQHQTLNAYAVMIDEGLRPNGDGWRLDIENRMAVLGGGSSFSFGVSDGSKVSPIAGLPAPLAGIGSVASQQPRYFHRLVGSVQLSGVVWPSQKSPARWIVVVQNLDDPAVFFDDVNTGVAIVATLAIAALLTLLMAIDVVIVRRSLAPVARASQAMADLLPHDLTSRIATSGLPIEVLPLVEGANVAFERLATAYANERDFLADAAHALRTPLAVLQLRVDDVTDPAMRSAMAAQVVHLRRIVDGLLTLAEIDSTAPPAPALVDLSSLASDRAAEIAPLALSKGQTIIVDAAQPLAVYTLADNATKALDVLLENAVRHTPSGTSIVVATKPGQIIVSDSGPGVDLSDVERLFARFQRGTAGTEGSGLGLSVAERLMKQAGGTIAFENLPEAGSRFTLVFSDLSTQIEP
ncbi:histidine kinase [Blastomonas aquatica]|uniref:histidine kinase n=2 Tax=Blastomonas aquatica TaxID=1510276 RepID=A0ABQ1J7N3_9SPHN|nr:histidine kinase [Blastomonas aquatica]